MNSADKSKLYKKVFFTPDPEKDSLLVAIAKLGGIKASEAPEFSDSYGEKRQGLPVFNKTGKRAQSLDAMAWQLMEFGYNVGSYETTGNSRTGYETNYKADLNKLRNAIDNELRGIETYSDTVDASVYDEAEAEDTFLPDDIDPSQVVSIYGSVECPF